MCHRLLCCVVLYEKGESLSQIHREKGDHCIVSQEEGSLAFLFLGKRELGDEDNEDGNLAGLRLYLCMYRFGGREGILVSNTN